MNFPAIPNFEIKEKVHTALCYTVYGATDLRSGNLVHLRVLDPSLSQDERSASAFLAGARLVKHMNHPNILQVYDCDQENRLFYVAVEPPRYEPLSSLILETFSLSLKDFLDIFLGIGMAVRQAHLRGLIHGLLHPKCIYINAACDIKIDCFGLQWTIPHVLQSRSKAALYQAKYLAPECFLEPEKADGRGDIYSLGVIMFEMLAGHPPFEGESIEEIREGHLSGKIPYLDCAALDLPREIEAVLAQSLAKNPLRRYQNFKEFLDCLSELKPAAQTFDISDHSVETTLESIQEDTRRNGKTAFAFARWHIAAALDRIKQAVLGKRLVFSAAALLLVGAIFFLFRHSGPSSSVNETRVGATQDAPSQALVSNTPIFIPQEEQILEPDNGKTSTQPAGQPASATEVRADSQLEPDGASEPEAQTRATTKTGTSPGVVPPAPAPLEPKKPAVETATLQVSVKAGGKPVEANVFLDNQRLGKTAADGSLQSDGLELNRTYTLKIIKEGYRSVSHTFATSELTVSLAFDLQPEAPATGTLIVDALPGADSVFVDGIFRSGKTPMELHMAPGNHALRLVNATMGKAYSAGLSLKAGEVLRLKHDFTKEETGKVAVTVKNAYEYGYAYVYVDGKLYPHKPNTTPLEITLPVGSHRIAVKREGFVAEPVEVVVDVTTDGMQSASFTLKKAK